MSPVCSDIVMSELQNTCLAQLSFEVPFFKRYVDDIVTAVPKDKCEELLSVFNGFHPKYSSLLKKKAMIEYIFWT